MALRGNGPAGAWETHENPGQRAFVQAFSHLNLTEGIMPALESSHALAYTGKLAATMSSDEIIIVNLSGRGDKDIHTVAEISGIEF